MKTDALSTSTIKSFTPVCPLEKETERHTQSEVQSELSESSSLMYESSSGFVTGLAIWVFKEFKSLNELSPLHSYFLCMFLFINFSICFDRVMLGAETDHGKRESLFLKVCSETTFCFLWNSSFWFVVWKNREENDVSEKDCPVSKCKLKRCKHLHLH